MELEEAIETLDAAIEFKNQEISSGRKAVERVENNQARYQNIRVNSIVKLGHCVLLLQSIVKHLREIAPPDLRRLLGRYFEKAILISFGLITQLI